MRPRCPTPDRTWAIGDQHAGRAQAPVHGASCPARTATAPFPVPKKGPPLVGYGAVTMKDAPASTVGTLPEQLWRSLTSDRGKELSAHAQFTIETGRPGLLRRSAQPLAARHQREQEPQQLCGRWGVVQSMGRVGSALDNAARALADNLRAQIDDLQTRLREAEMHLEHLVITRKTVTGLADRLPLSPPEHPDYPPGSSPPSTSRPAPGGPRTSVNPRPRTAAEERRRHPRCRTDDDVLSVITGLPRFQTTRNGCIGRWRWAHPCSGAGPLAGQTGRS